MTVAGFLLAIARDCGVQFVVLDGRVWAKYPDDFHGRDALEALLSRYHDDLVLLLIETEGTA
jgi:hypothetical protein